MKKINQEIKYKKRPRFEEPRTSVEVSCFKKTYSIYILTLSFIYFLDL